MIKIMGIFGMLLCFAGCQKSVKHQKKDSVAYQLQETMQETLARLNDMPDIPLSVVVQKIETSTQNSEDMQIFCSLGTATTWPDVKSYYTQEMERLGWNFEAEYQGLEQQLIFRKPSGSLSLIAHRDNQLLITIIRIHCY